MMPSATFRSDVITHAIADYNQKAALGNRAGLVEHLYREPIPAHDLTLTRVPG